MPRRLRCPACDRALDLPAAPGPMTCDGCRHRFDATGLRFVAASTPRRLIGWAFLAASAYLFLVRVVPVLAIAAEEARAGRGDPVGISAFILSRAALQPTIPLGLGWYFLRGRVVGTVLAEDADGERV